MAHWRACLHSCFFTDYILNKNYFLNYLQFQWQHIFPRWGQKSRRTKTEIKRKPETIETVVLVIKRKGYFGIRLAGLPSHWKPVFPNFVQTGWMVEKKKHAERQIEGWWDGHTDLTGL